MRELSIEEIVVVSGGGWLNVVWGAVWGVAIGGTVGFVTAGPLGFVVGAVDGAVEGVAYALVVEGATNTYELTQ